MISRLRRRQTFSPTLLKCAHQSTCLLPRKQQKMAQRGPTAPGTVMVVNQDSPQTHTGVEKPAELPFKGFHLCFGIAHVAVGGFMLILELAAVITAHITNGPGIFCGIFVVVVGILSIVASKKNSKCCLIACMVLCIIASVTCFIGVIVCGAEINTARYAQYLLYNNGNLIPFANGKRYAHSNDANNRNTYKYNSYINFSLAKSIIILLCCFYEFVVTIVHAWRICRVGSCCMTRTRQRASQAYYSNDHTRQVQTGGVTVIQTG